MWRKTARNNDLPSEQQILSELEMEKEEISRIQKQRDVIGRVQESMVKKDQEIERLTALVEKYRPYYEHCSTMRVELAEKESALRAYAKENQLLRRQFEQLLAESEHLSSQVKALEMEKQALVRERHSIERVNRQIEETFKEYQIQCRRRQQELVRQMEEHRKQTTNLQIANEELKQLKEAMQDNEDGEDVKQLQAQLAEKDRQLQKAKNLNHQLSVQFDKSVNKICQFQRQLNNYRVENHQLKKTLGLVLQQDKYQKLQQKYMKRKDESPLSQSQQDDSDPQSSPQMSQLKL